MIAIHQGVFNNANVHGGIVVATPEDYVEARRAIRDALANNSDLEIYISNRIYDKWFWDLEDQTGIQFVDEDPTERLRNKLGAHVLPAHLTADMILDLELLEAPDPASPILDVSQWVAGTSLGDVWAENSPSFEHLSALVSWWAKQGISPLKFVVQAVANQRLKQWASGADGDLRLAYQTLQKSPTRVICFLCAHEALSVYDAGTRDNWLREKGWFLEGFDRIADRLSELPLPAEVDRGLSVFIEAHWQRRLNELLEKVQGAFG